MTRRVRGVAIAVQNVQRAVRVPSVAKLTHWARAALDERARGELTLRIVGRSESAALNERYRGKKGPTNVLSFPTEGAEPPKARPNELLPFGDVVICAAVVAREAREQSKPMAAHWAHLVIHGTLHLQGYDHENPRDATAMEARERALLADLGFPDPYSIK
jgi:probable rRNA maturation factor